ncbi:hypothetical protein DAMA08_015210 [Martiniozyma asiatica (nom. inval.)]|nr:hypothetical protein DAMA08_015210 [Martiniozyma asiatica]
MSRPSARELSKRLQSAQLAREAKKKFALASLKDTFSGLLGGGAEADADADEFDLNGFQYELYLSPGAWRSLPYYKQQAVVSEVLERQKKSWRKMDPDVKRFAVWWAYGSMGPRDGWTETCDWFSPKVVATGKTAAATATATATATETETGKATGSVLDELIHVHSPSESKRSALATSQNTLDAAQLNRKLNIPPDLPFKYPSILAAAPGSSSKGCKAKRLSPLDPRSFGLNRIKQYQQDRKMNPIARLSLFFCVILTVLCFKADRRVNNTGIVPVYPWDVVAAEERAQVEAEAILLLKQEQEQKQKQQQQQQDASKRHWYYLWLA